MPRSNHPSSLIFARKMRKLSLQRNKNRWKTRKIRRNFAKQQEQFLQEQSRKGHETEAKMSTTPSELSNLKKAHNTSVITDIQAKIELDSLEELMSLMEVITDNFHELKKKAQEKWYTSHFRQLNSLVRDCEAFEISAKQMSLPVWESRMVSLLSSLYYLNNFKQKPTFSSLEKIQSQITVLDQDLKQLYIFKHENTIRPELISSTSIIFILEDDTLYADTIALQLQNLGFDVQCCGTIEKIRTLSKHVRPDLVLIDLNLREGQMAGLDYLKEIQEHTPTLIMSARQDIEARLEAVRAGAKDYITKPMDMDKLHLMICKHLELNYQKTPKTLIIDDDELTAMTYSKFLEQYNIEAHILTDASKTLEEIESYKPDLIFMDIKMPYANGYEVANVIHQVYGKDNSPEIVYMTGALKNEKNDYNQDDLEESGILLKPLKPTQMANIVERQIQKNEQCLENFTRRAL